VIGAAWLGEAWPRGVAALGAGVVVLAIVLFSALVARREAPRD
jgi:hypothetical protein